MRARRIAASVAATVVGTELIGHGLARRLPPLDPARRTAVIVLGYRSRRDGSSHFVQRWRIRMAVRTLHLVSDGWLILSGGTTGRAPRSEAAVMAAFATGVLRVPGDRIQLEEAARSTWENVHLSVPLATAGGAEQIVIVSDSFHVTRAAHYVRRQFPDLYATLARPDADPPLAYAWLKPALLADLCARIGRDVLQHRRARRR